MMPYFCSFLMILSLMACATTSQHQTGSCGQYKQKLNVALTERLQFMPDVAKWKWCHKKPILDPAREQQVLDKAIEQGAKYGLSKSVVRDVFQKQMDEAKAIQSKVVDELKTDPIDCGLQTDDGLNQIRAQINQSTDKILQSLSDLKEAGCL